MNLKSWAGGTAKSNVKHNMMFIFTIYVILLSVSVALIGLMRFIYDKPDYRSQFTTYDSGWVDMDTKQSVNLADPIMKSVHVGKLLENVQNNQVVFFRAKNINVRVFVGNEERVDSDSIYHIERGGMYKTPGTYYVTVPLSSEDNGKYISICIDKPYGGNDKSCNIKTIYIGSEGAILRTEIGDNLVAFTACMFIIFLGVLFTVVSFPLRKYDNGGNNLLYLGLFAITVGVWALTETHFLVFVFDDAVFLHFITGVTLLLITVPLFIFFKMRHSEVGTLPVYLTGAVALITYLLSVHYHFSGGRDLHESIRLAHISLATGVVCTIYYAFRVFVSSRFKDVAFWGLLGIAIFSGLDIFCYYLQILPDNSTLTRFGVLLYIAVLGYQIITVYIKSYNNMIRAEVLHKLAFTDILTELNNRNAFTEEMQRLSSSQDAVGRIIVVMDMNNLKEINDTMGHAMGDKALLESADRIREDFSRYGTCYRIGGDEFVFISDEKMSEDELIKVHKRFFKSLEQRNATKANRFDLFIAFGYAIITEDVDANATFKVADERMYSDKKRIKEVYGVGRK